MITDYDLFMAQWELSNDVHGACERATQCMQERFPELQRVCGFVRGSQSRPYPHWWCVSPSGEILDPTRRQFAAIEPIWYDPLGDRVPRGKCLYCGEVTYNDSFSTDTCTAECHRALVASFSYLRQPTNPTDEYEDQETCAGSH